MNSNEYGFLYLIGEEKQDVYVKPEQIDAMSGNNDKSVIYVNGNAIKLAMPIKAVASEIQASRPRLILRHPNEKCSCGENLMSYFPNGDQCHECGRWFDFDDASYWEQVGDDYA